ncbi:hypothetical protein J6X13_00435 [Candidatus Saccharibacteria bacterium]|nr:hypothetical protein [Candidatus Saccharibacteria bacterium]
MNTNVQTEATQKVFDVVDGPSKGDIFDAVKYAYSRTSNVGVNFKIAFGYTKPKGDPEGAVIYLHACNFRLRGIEHEDGSGENFNIKGDCYVSFRPMCSEVSHMHGKNFSMYFNTKDRTGTITFS